MRIHDMERTGPAAPVSRPGMFPTLAALRTLLVCGSLLFVCVSPAAANPRYAALVLDAQTGAILFDRYADEARFPASSA